MHEGGYGVAAEGRNDFRFSRPDGRRIDVVPEMDVTAVTSSTCIEELNAAEGLDIDASTGASLWDGANIDYSIAVDALYTRDWLRGARDPPCV